MPPKCKFTREEIVGAALNVVREKGYSSLTARGLAEALGSSPKPIFGLFENMEEVHKEVLAAADQLYQTYLQKDMAEGKYPPYKASGMAYIRLAKEEPELFKLLFMRDRSREEIHSGEEELESLIKLIQENTGLGREEAKLFHLEMWIVVHGVATMIATLYLDWDSSFVSRVLSDIYIGLKYRYCGEEKTDGSH